VVESNGRGRLVLGIAFGPYRNEKVLVMLLISHAIQMSDAGPLSAMYPAVLVSWSAHATIDISGVIRGSNGSG